MAHAHGVELDRDAALALEVQGVQDLLFHLALLQCSGRLDQPVGQGGLPVVDVGDDAEVADMIELQSELSEDEGQATNRSELFAAQEYSKRGAHECVPAPSLLKMMLRRRLRSGRRR